MNEHDHRAIVREGSRCLAPWARKMWKPLQKEMESTCMVPDVYALDLLECRDGPWRRYFPAKLPQFNFEKKKRCARSFLPASRFYLREVVRYLREGNLKEAARCAGVYSHYVGDFSQPAHHYELDILDLLPPPPHMRNCNPHHKIESLRHLPFRAEHPSRLLGVSVDEVLFRLDAEYGALYKKSVAAVVPILQALYRRSSDRARRTLTPVVADSARLFSDFLHSAAALAHKRFDPSELRGLARTDLRSIEPHAYDVEFNYGHKVLLDAITLNDRKEALPFAVTCGGKRKRVKGLCAIPHALPLKGVPLESSITYKLPRGTFDRFEALVGPLAYDIPQAGFRFSALLDGDEVYSTAMLKPRCAAVPVSAPLPPRTSLLKLLFESDGSTRKLAYPIVAEPVLYRVRANR